MDMLKIVHDIYA